MAKKKKGGGGGGGNTASNDGVEKKKGDGGEKKEETPITVILKIDMHCEGCATKIVKCVKGFAEVETVKSESQANKLTVVGKVDPITLRDKLAAKTNKKVDLVSPQPKKDNKDDGDSGDAKKKPPEKSNDDKKTKEPPVTTAVLKLNLHCQGCVQKIHKIVTKTKGFTEMSIDKEKDLLMVKGSMDMKVLAETLKAKLRRSVDIVPPKKEKEKGDNNGGGGDKKKKEAEEGKEGGKLEGNRMDFPPGPTGYGQQIPYVIPYGPGYGAPGYPIPPPPMYIGNPPEMFSDENPNACSIM